MAESDLYKKGEAIRRNLMGEVAFARRQAEYNSNPVMKKFIDVATETGTNTNASTVSRQFSQSAPPRQVATRSGSRITF